MRIRALLVTAVIVLALAACSVTTHATSCSSNVCAVNLTGEQTHELGATEPKRRLTVDKIESDAVTVSVLSDQARLTVGQSDTVGSMTVRVDGIEGGGTVKLRVTLN